MADNLVKDKSERVAVLLYLIILCYWSDIEMIAIYFEVI